MVFLFKGDLIDNCKTICRSYYRQAQIKDFCSAVGEPPVAFCGGHHGLYLIAKESDGRLAVAFANLSDDRIVSPSFELSKKYKNAEFFGCDGKISKNNIILDNINAHEFGAFMAEV